MWLSVRVCMRVCVRFRVYVCVSECSLVYVLVRVCVLTRVPFYTFFGVCLFLCQFVRWYVCYLREPVFVRALNSVPVFW